MSNSTSLSLIRAIKVPDDREAWARFAQLYRPLTQAWAYRWCRRWGLPDADAWDVAEEVAQNLMSTIHARMQTYALEKRGKGGYRAWLRTVTHNALLEFLRKRQAERGSGDTAVLEKLAEVPEARGDLDQELDRLSEQEVFQEAQDRVRGKVEEREWQIVEALGWEDGRTRKRAAGPGPARPTPAQVAEQYGLDVNAVFRIKFRVVRALKEEIARLLKEAGEA